MVKLLLILMVGLVLESTGVVFLKKGMMQIGDLQAVTLAEVFRVLREGVVNSNILLGVFFEALFFGCLLFLLARSEVSFLWPLSGLSFVFATVAAIWFLGEQVSSIRWAGVVLIVIGAGLISYSEQTRTQGLRMAPSRTVSPTPSGSLDATAASPGPAQARPGEPTPSSQP